MFGRLVRMVVVGMRWHGETAGPDPAFHEARKGSLELSRRLWWGVACMHRTAPNHSRWVNLKFILFLLVGG
jgi:hypothetical protein